MIAIQYEDTVMLGVDVILFCVNAGNRRMGWRP